MITKVLGYDIQIKLVDFGKEPENHGTYSDGVIELHSRDSKAKQKKTLFHEEIHALLDKSGINAALAHATNQLFAEYLDEQLAHAIEEFVFTNYDIKRKSGL